MDIGRCFNDAIEVYKKNLAQLVVAAFLLEVLSILSLSLLMGPLIGGWCVMTVNALRREDKYVDLSDLFAGFKKWPSLMGLFYLTLFAVLIGWMLCIAPGVWLMTIWFFPFFIVMDRDQGVFASLRTSQNIVMAAGFWNYLLLVIVVLALSVAPSSIPYVGVVIAWFVVPIAWLVEAAAYVRETDGLPSEKPMMSGKV